MYIGGAPPSSPHLTKQTASAMSSSAAAAAAAAASQLTVEDLAWLRIHRTDGYPPVITLRYTDHPKTIKNMDDVRVRVPPIPYRSAFADKLKDTPFMKAAFARLMAHMHELQQQHIADLNSRTDLWIKVLDYMTDNPSYDRQKPEYWTGLMSELTVKEWTLFDELHIGGEHHHTAMELMRTRPPAPRPENCIFCLGTKQARIAVQCPECMSLDGHPLYQNKSLF